MIKLIAATVLTISILSSAYAQPISQLPPAILPLSGSEILPMTQNNTSVKITVDNLRTSGTVEMLANAGNAVLPDARTNLGLGTISTLNSPLPLANGGTAATSAVDARTNLGLGTISTLNSPLPLANGGTAATSAVDARNNIDAMARDASNVNTAITARGNLSAMARNATDATLPTARTNLGIYQFDPVRDHGAPTDGITDATATLAASLNDCNLVGGGRVILGPYIFNINTASLTVPTGCSLESSYQPKSKVSLANNFNTEPGIHINPAHTINVANGASLRRLLIIPNNLTAPTTYQTAASMVSGFSGTGVTITGHGTVLEDIQVLGFATGISTNGFAQFDWRNVFLDNTLCASIRFAHDQAAMSHIECWPFLTASQAWTTASSNVSGAADNGSGKIRLTVASTANFATGNTLFVYNAGGFLGANTKCTNATVVNATTIDCPNLSSAPSATASVVNGSNVLTLTVADPSIHQGQTVTDATTGGNIPGGTTVTWVHDTTVYMSAAATGTGAADTINFANGAYTAGGTVTLDNNDRSASGFFGENNTLLECVMCYVYGHSIGLDLLDEITDTWAVNIDSNPTTKDPTSLGIRVRGNSYGNRISGAYIVAGVGLVGNSSAVVPNNISIVRYYNVSPTYTPTVYLVQGVFNISDSGAQQGSYLYTSSGVGRVQYCGGYFASHNFHWDSASAYLKTTVCDGTVYQDGVARGSQLIQAVGTNANVAAGTTVYFAGSAINGTEAIVRVPVAVTGTFSNMIITNSASPGAGETQTFTLRVNGADTAVTCTISGAVERSCADTIHTAAKPAGGTYDVKVVASNNGGYVASFVQGSVEFRRP